MKAPTGVLLANLRALGACDPGCEGRCKFCPDEVGRMAATEIEQLLAEKEWRGLTAADVIGVITGQRQRRRPLPNPMTALGLLTWLFDDERHADVIVKALREEGFEIVPSKPDDDSSTQMEPKK